MYYSLSIDKTDNKILKIIKNNSRTPYLQISSKVGRSKNAVKERIRRLYGKGIIVSNRIFLNPNRIGKESYRILFKLKNNPEEKQSLLNFAKLDKSIIYALELMGTYHLDLEIEIDNREKLQDLLINLRNSFSIIDDYEIMPLFYDSGIDFYPIDKK